MANVILLNKYLHLYSPSSSSKRISALSQFNLTTSNFIFKTKCSICIKKSPNETELFLSRLLTLICINCAKRLSAVELIYFSNYLVQGNKKLHPF